MTLRDGFHPLAAALIRDFEPALCAAALPDALARFGGVVPTLLRPALNGLAAAARGPLLARLASGPRTLLHGSATATHAFAPRGVLAGAEDGADAAATVRFIGYADAAAGRGALDVARLLASAMEPNDRHALERTLICADSLTMAPATTDAESGTRRNAYARAEREHGLLGEWHDALCEGGVTTYSMYDAWEDYRFGVAYSLAGAVAAAGAPGLSEDTDPIAWCAAPSKHARAGRVFLSSGLGRSMTPPRRVAGRRRASGCGGRRRLRTTSAALRCWPGDERWRRPPVEADCQLLPQAVSSPFRLETRADCADASAPAGLSSTRRIHARSLPRAGRCLMCPSGGVALRRPPRAQGKGRASAPRRAPPRSSDAVRALFWQR